jgi:hypothetical protein
MTDAVFLLLPLPLLFLSIVVSPVSILVSTIEK